jgi:hypothetical protein
MSLHEQASRNQVDNCIDDSTLIQTFVDGFVEGQSIMLSNHNLRTESTFGSVQLLAKKEGLVSSANLIDTPLSAWVRKTSSYWELVHQAMLAKNFYPIVNPQKQDCYTYQHRTVPEGYEVHCTTAKELWRMCWGRNPGSSYGIPLDLLVLSRGHCGRRETWYPIKGMDSQNGQLLIKLLGGEVAINSSELVVWLKQIDDRDASLPDSSRHRLRPGLRGYFRLHS